MLVVDACVLLQVVTARERLAAGGAQEVLLARVRPTVPLQLVAAGEAFAAEGPRADVGPFVVVVADVRPQVGRFRVSLVTDVANVDLDAAARQEVLLFVAVAAVAARAALALAPTRRRVRTQRRHARAAQEGGGGGRGGRRGRGERSGAQVRTSEAVGGGLQVEKHLGDRQRAGADRQACHQRSLEAGAEGEGREGWAGPPDRGLERPTAVVRLQLHALLHEALEDVGLPEGLRVALTRQAERQAIVGR